MKKRIFSFRTLLFCLLFYFVVCWKLPFYMLLMCVDLPEDAIVIKRQVSLTDVYYWHILAEMVFVSDQGYDNIKETILAENRIIMGESDLMDWHIMSRAGVEEWDDSCLSEREIDELAAGIGNRKWYYVSIGMIVEVFIFFRIAAFLVILIIMHIVLKCTKKKEK